MFMLLRNAMHGNTFRFNLRLGNMFGHRRNDRIVYFTSLLQYIQQCGQRVNGMQSDIIVVYVQFSALLSIDHDNCVCNNDSWNTQ